MKPEHVKHAEEISKRLKQYDRLYMGDYNLPKEVRVFAAALYCISLRETYPDGPSAFDAITKEAAEYFDRQTKRAKK